MAFAPQLNILVSSVGIPWNTIDFSELGQLSHDKKNTKFLLCLLYWNWTNSNNVHVCMYHEEKAKCLLHAQNLVCHLLFFAGDNSNSGTIFTRDFWWGLSHKWIKFISSISLGTWPQSTAWFLVRITVIIWPTESSPPPCHFYQQRVAIY